MDETAPGIKVAISQDFFTAFADIPRGKQKKVNEFVSKFRINPRASSINYERINDAASPQYRSVRIDQEYRGIVYQPEKGNVYLMMWVDKHDDAYDWARRHKCHINPETGVLQLYEVVHSPAVEAEMPSEVEIDDPQSRTSAEPLFEYRDRELLRLGVPDERLPLIRQLTNIDQLEAIQSKLPVDSYEALLFLADGVPLDEVLEEYALPAGPQVDTDDLAAALQRTQSQRKFHVVGDELELQSMLEAPLEQWRVFLHPTQRKLVERDWNGPVRVLGGAGTGKTVVAMHRARWLVRHVLAADERLLFTTFTRNLSTDIEANLRKICSVDEMKRIEVTNIDAWMHRFLKRENQAAQIVYPGQPNFDACWDSAIQLASSELTLPDSFYQEEWRLVILPRRIVSQREYFKVSRVGRGVPLSRKQRALIWPVFEEMRLQLHQKRLMSSEDAVHLTLDLLQSGAVARPYRAAVVDEAQDFGGEALTLVRHVVEEEKNDIMVVGDGHQRIYGRKAPLSRSGISIRGRGRKLRVNYRTTEQIRRFATAILEDVEVDDLDDNLDSINGYRSLVDGQPPVLKSFANNSEEAGWVIEEIERLVETGLASQDICIVGRTATQCRTVEKELAARGSAFYKISRDSADNHKISGVRIANMHRIKGLEFRVVFLIGVNEGVIPLEYALGSTDDPVEQRARELAERTLFHVAGTRAVNGLYVTWSGEPSRYLPGV